MMPYETREIIYGALTLARKQLQLWMKDHGQDIATQEAIAAIDKARDLVLEG